MNLDLFSFLAGAILTFVSVLVVYKISSRTNDRMMAVKELEIARLSLSAPLSDRVQSAENQLRAQAEVLERLDMNVGKAITLMMREDRETQVSSGFPAVRVDGGLPTRLVPPRPKELSETS